MSTTEPSPSPSPSPSSWRPLRPSIAMDLRHARLQLHYAAQFATALGISYLPAKPDDSHTNLGWNPSHEALESREVIDGALRLQVAVRPADLTLLVLLDGAVTEPIPLHGISIQQAESALRSALTAAGLDGRRLTLRRHYELPPNRLATGATFDASHNEALAELSSWYANAAVVLEEYRSRTGGSEIRCWPHHFDIATLVEFGPGVSSGAGMLPGDAMYPEPYFYVNAYPAPAGDLEELPLKGGGRWNREDWFGAILTGSRLSSDPAEQPAQVRDFLSSAFDACGGLLRTQLPASR